MMIHPFFQINMLNPPFHLKPPPSPDSFFIFKNRDMLPVTHTWNLGPGHKEGNNSDMFQSQELICRVKVGQAQLLMLGAFAPCYYSVPPNGHHIEKQARFFQILFFQRKTLSLDFVVNLSNMLRCS